MSKTKKPCPLCKESGLRDAGDVCTGCRRAHERLLRLESELSARGELQVYNIPVTGWPYRAPFKFHVSRELHAALSKMLLAVAPLASVTSVGGNFVPHFQQYYTKTEPRLISAEAAESIKTFFELMHAEFERCASDSIQQGKDLLLQFAQGGITPDQLNRAGISDGRL